MGRLCAPSEAEDRFGREKCAETRRDVISNYCMEVCCGFRGCLVGFSGRFVGFLDVFSCCEGRARSRNLVNLISCNRANGFFSCKGYRTFQCAFRFR